MIFTNEILTPLEDSMKSIIDTYDLEKDAILTFPNITGSPCDVIEVKFAK